MVSPNLKYVSLKGLDSDCMVLSNWVSDTRGIGMVNPNLKYVSLKGLDSDCMVLSNWVSDT